MHLIIFYFYLQLILITVQNKLWVFHILPSILEYKMYYADRNLRKWKKRYLSQLIMGVKMHMCEGDASLAVVQWSKKRLKNIRLDPNIFTIKYYFHLHCFYCFMKESFPLGWYWNTRTAKNFRDYNNSPLCLVQE